jgi:hypothetical protein
VHPDGRHFKKFKILSVPPGLGRRVSAAGPGPRRRGRAAGAASLGPGCQGSSRGAVAVDFLCGSGAFCPKNCAALLSGVDSPSLKMGEFCRKFAEDEKFQGLLCPMERFVPGPFHYKISGTKKP